MKNQNQKPKLKPILVQHKQNDAIVELQTYLRIKNRVVNQINNINNTNQEIYKKLEECQLNFNSQFNYFKTKLGYLLTKDENN